MSDNDPSTVYEAGLKISLLVEMNNDLERQITSDPSKETSLRPLIDKNNLERDRLNRMMGSLCKLEINRSQSYQQNQTPGSYADYREEAHVTQTFSRFMTDTAKLDGSSFAEFTTFLGRLQIFYKAHIDGHPNRTRPFFNSIYSHLDISVERQIGEELLRCTTWDEVKALLEKNFGDRSHFYLSLSEVWDVEFDSSKPLAHYAAEVSKKMREAKGAIKAAFKSDKKRDLEADDLFEIVEAMLLYLQLRSNEPQVYNQLSPALSNVFSIKELARLAQQNIQNRVDTSVSVNFQKKKGGKWNKRKKSEKKDGNDKDSSDSKTDKKIMKTSVEDQLQPFQYHQVKKKNSSKVYFASTTITAGSKSFDAMLEIDSGATTSTISADCVPDPILKQLKPCPFSISGFDPKSPPQRPLGLLDCKFSFNNGPQIKVELVVTPIGFPNLLGRDVLDNKAIDGFAIDNKKRTLTFNFDDSFTKTKTQTIQLKCVSKSRVKCFRITHNQRSKATKVIPEDTKFTQAASTTPNDNGCPVKRVKEVLNITFPDNSDKSHQVEVAKLLLEYRDIFGADGKELGEFPYEAEVRTNGQTRAVPQYSIPQAFHEPITSQVKKMLEEGVVREISDPKGWNSPLIPIIKKDKTIRLCVNFKRTVNLCLSDKSDNFHLPSMDTVIGQLGSGNKFYSTCDLRSGYWQLRLKKEDQHKTSFTWGNKNYCFNRLPFGYKNSGNIFSRQVNQMLDSSPSRESTHSYIDDVIIAQSTFPAYLKALRDFFIALRKFGARLKSTKCTFLESSARFLGRVITQSGIRPDPDNMSALRSMKPPRNVKELSSLIGSLNWVRSFLETRVGEKIATDCFSHRMVPLNTVRNSATETGIYKWSQEADSALRELQMRLASPPTISFPNYNETFHFYTDASHFAAGGVLLQEYDNRAHLVAAISHTFTKDERKWNVSEKETYAIVWGCERLAMMLKGRHFYLHTDHRSLVYLHNKRFKNSKISRWQTRLEEFDFTIIYIKGSDNQFADFMSRRPGVDDPTLDLQSDFPVGKEYEIEPNSNFRVFIPFWSENQFPDKLTLSRVKVHKVKVSALVSPSETPIVSTNYGNLLEHQMQDHALSRIINHLESSSDPLDIAKLLKNNDHRVPQLREHQKSLFVDHVTGALMVQVKSGARAVVPEHVRSHFLFLAHDLSAHGGVPRTLERLEDVWWYDMIKDVENYVHSCVQCLRRKGATGKRTKPPLGQLFRGKAPGESLSIDFAHMPNIRGYRYYLICVCNFSRYVWCVPTKKDDAVACAKALVDRIFLPFDFVPTHIHSDRGLHFISAVVDNLCKLNGIRHSISTAFHPESNSFAERNNRTVKNALFCTSNMKNGRNWVDSLPHVMRCLNSMTNKSTKVSPRECWFGRKSTFTHQNGEEMTAESPLIYGLNVKSLARSIHKAVEISMTAADHAMQLRMKNEPSPAPIPAGSCVYIKREMLSDPKRNNQKWVGPLKLVASNSHICLVEDAKGARDIVHRSHTCHASQRIQDLKFIEEFEMDYIFPHLTQIVKSKVPQTTSQRILPQEQPNTVGSSSQGERSSTPIKTTQVQTNNPDISPVKPAACDVLSGTVTLDTSKQSTDTVGSSKSQSDDAMELGNTGGTIWEETLFQSAISEPQTAENSSAQSRDAANLEITPSNVASPHRPTPVKEKRAKQQKKRARPEASPNSTVVELESKAPRTSSRAKKAVQPMNIQSSRSKSYD